MRALPRLHPSMSPSWNGELAIDADVLSWARQQCPRNHECYSWRSIPTTNGTPLLQRIYALLEL